MTRSLGCSVDLAARRAFCQLIASRLVPLARILIKTPVLEMEVRSKYNDATLSRSRHLVLTGVLVLGRHCGVSEP